MEGEVVMKLKQLKPSKNRKKLKVAAYCRVSTEHDDQENSLENQKAHYEEEIKGNHSYEYAGVYYDFGISGFKEDRDGFREMMDDALAGKIDLIITKSISRFARNTELFLDSVRKLRERGIGVYFELQGINTLSANGELLMTIYAAFAEAESVSTRELIKMTYRRKYEAGITVNHIERSFGYTKDESGIKIVPEEARWVRKAYEMSADGYTDVAILEYLNKNGVTSAAGVPWSPSSIARLLANEIYKGDFICHKTYVNDKRKQVRNKGEEDMWYVEDDHPAIVSRKLWQKAQDVKNARMDRKSCKDEEGERPYKNKLFCAYCGHRLQPRVYSRGNKMCWNCTGVVRFGKGFCRGVNLPDVTAKEWDPQERIYVYEKDSDKGVREYGYYAESYWKRSHKKKVFDSGAPELNEENYPYYKKIYCAECGSILVRLVQHKNNKVLWICNGTKRKGVSFCRGVRIPDEEVRKMKIEARTYISERRKADGTKCYIYSGTESAEERTEKE